MTKDLSQTEKNEVIARNEVFAKFGEYLKDTQPQVTQP